MILYFADKTWNIVGTASTVLQKGVKILNDKYVKSLKGGTSSLTFYLSVENADLSAIEKIAFPGYSILRKEKNTEEVFAILETEYDTSTGLMWVSAESGGLELLNDVLPAYANSTARSLQYYAEHFLTGTGFTIGENELASLTRTLSWDGESTVTQRLQSLANYFGGEIAYSFDIENLTVTGKHVNFYNQRGKDIGRTLRTSVEIDKILVKRNAGNFATALYPTSGTITLSGASYDDGDIYVDGVYLKSRNALDEWGGNHIFKLYSSSASDRESLLTESIAKLKQVRNLSTTYDVKFAYMPDNIDVGDTVTIIDERNDLALTARIEQITIQDSAETYSATISNIAEV